MATDQLKCTVIILGTMHLETREFPAYSKRLGEIIEEINPDVICSELSPEQLEGTQSCNSKPEQRDVVIPTAKKLKIPIVPIQPLVKIGLEWEKRLSKTARELKKREASKHIIEYMDFLAKQEAELWGNQMKYPDCIERVQLNEFHVFSEARDRLGKQFLPKLAALFIEWNEIYLRNIIDTLDSHQGKLLMVIAGLWHKYWLWNRLQKQNNVNVYNLQLYRMIQK